MTKIVHPYQWGIVGWVNVGVRCEGDLAGLRENNPTVDVDGLYFVQMPNCEKKSRRTVERIPESCRRDTNQS